MMIICTFWRLFVFELFCLIRCGRLSGSERHLGSWCHSDHSRWIWSPLTGVLWSGFQSAGGLRRPDTAVGRGLGGGRRSSVYPLARGVVFHLADLAVGGSWGVGILGGPSASLRSVLRARSSVSVNSVTVSYISSTSPRESVDCRTVRTA